MEQAARTFLLEYEWTTEKQRAIDSFPCEPAECDERSCGVIFWVGLVWSRVPRLPVIPETTNAVPIVRVPVFLAKVVEEGLLPVVTSNNTTKDQDEVSLFFSPNFHRPVVARLQHPHPFTSHYHRHHRV